MPKCNYCSKEAEKLLRCSACKQVHYCDAAHQRVDWPNHKSKCKLLQQQSTEIRSKYSKSLPSLRDDFIKKWTYIPNGSGIDENLLVMFHGMGDTEEPFIKLAKSMNLPQTAYLVIRAPLEVPLIENSYCWIPSIDETTFEFLTDSPKRLEGLQKIRRSILNIISQLESTWLSTKIFFLGFSQGANVAIDAALHATNRLGGVIAISDSVLIEFTRSSTNSLRNDVPILITHGIKDEQLPLKEAKNKYLWLTKFCKRIEMKEYNKKHEMISGQDEMRDVLKFLSEFLYLRNLALENQSDVIEINDNVTVNKIEQ